MKNKLNSGVSQEWACFCCLAAGKWWHSRPVNTSNFPSSGCIVVLSWLSKIHRTSSLRHRGFGLNEILNPQKVAFGAILASIKAALCRTVDCWVSFPGRQKKLHTESSYNYHITVVCLCAPVEFVCPVSFSKCSEDWKNLIGGNKCSSWWCAWRKTIQSACGKLSACQNGGVWVEGEKKDRHSPHVCLTQALICTQIKGSDDSSVVTLSGSKGAPIETEELACVCIQYVPVGRAMV